jgi:hypothetical protein
LRFFFPSILGDGRQVSSLFNVRVTAVGGVTPSYQRGIAAADRDVVQVAMIEPDSAPAGVPASENTSLLFWKELTVASAPTQNNRVRGMMVRDTNAFSSIFNISTNTSGGLRTWPGTTDTGDYAKGAFYFGPGPQRRYFVPWIEDVSGGSWELRSKVFAM